jgi:hypothetical protein
MLAAGVLLQWARGVSMVKHAILLLVFAGLAAGAAWAADDPMVGDWKLNPQKSKLVDEMKVASLGGNKYSFDFGGGQPETIVADGIDQPGIFGTTLAVTAAAPDEWRVVRKKDGRIEVTGIWTLSKDGSKLHDDYTEVGDNGKTIHVVYVYERRAAGPGFAGDWVSTSEQVDTVYKLQVRPYEGDGLSITSSLDGVAKNIKFDGRDYPSADPAANRVTSARRVSERTIQVTDKSRGKIVATREISVSADGKTLTTTINAPGRSEPDVLVFERE